MSSVTVSITRNKKPDTLPYKWAVVKHDRDRFSAPDAMHFAPDAVHVQDRPQGDGVGHQIPVLASVWSYLRKTNNADAMKWLETYEAMWINNGGKGGQIITTSNVNAESIIGGGNLIAYDDEKNTHVRIVARHYKFEFGTLNPENDNFNTFPWLYWYPTAINAAGVIRKVTSGIDVFIPLLICTELWIGKNKVRLLDKKPDKWGIENVLS